MDVIEDAVVLMFELANWYLKIKLLFLILVILGTIFLWLVNTDGVLSALCNKGDFPIFKHFTDFEVSKKRCNKLEKAKEVWVHLHVSTVMGN